MQVLRRENEGGCKKQAEIELTNRYPGAAIEERIAETIAIARRTLRQFERIPVANKPEVARQMLLQNILGEIVLPSFEEWSTETAQPIL
jgi:hypothetical protein